MVRTIMRSFKINELSAVDNPANVHARATIMKRDEPDGGADAFEKAVAAIQSATGCSRLVALERAYDEADYAPYGMEVTSKRDTRDLAERLRVPDRSAQKAAFMDKVAAIQARESCSRSRALEIAASENSAELAAWQD